jgi:hypothetical protein
VAEDTGSTEDENVVPDAPIALPEPAILLAVPLLDLLLLLPVDDEDDDAAASDEKADVPTRISSGSCC